MILLKHLPRIYLKENHLTFTTQVLHHQDQWDQLMQLIRKESKELWEVTYRDQSKNKRLSLGQIRIRTSSVMVICYLKWLIIIINTEWQISKGNIQNIMTQILIHIGKKCLSNSNIEKIIGDWLLIWKELEIETWESRDRGLRQLRYSKVKWHPGSLRRS